MSSAVRSSRVALVGGIVLVALVVAAIAGGPLGSVFEHEVGVWQNAVEARLSVPGALSGWRLNMVAFFGGLIASISPCILGMLPLNLSYIGASNLRTRTAAVRVAAMFVLGVVVVNVVLGLISSLFFALFVEYRAPVNMAVGLLTVVMGVWMAGLIHLPTPQIATRIPLGAGSFIVGVGFALVATPCASPILVFILGAVSLEASPTRAVAAMTFYAIGYTLVLFLASLFAGIVAASRRVLAQADLVSGIAAATLVVIGFATFAYGLTQL